MIAVMSLLPICARVLVYIFFVGMEESIESCLEKSRKRIEKESYNMKLMRISLCYEKNEKDFTYKYLVYNMFLTDYFKKSMMKGTNIVDDSNNDRSG